PNASTPNVKSSISGGKVVSTAGDINVKAHYNADPDGKVTNGGGATATAYAAAGSLIASSGATATATDTPTMEASVASGAELDASGTVTVSLLSKTEAESSAAGQSGGLVGVGASKAFATGSTTGAASMSGHVGTATEAGANALVVN